MGEITDMIVNGDLCESCGEFLGEGSGHSRRCGSCRGGSTMTADKIPPTCGMNSRKLAASFHAASELAKANGMTLSHPSLYQYQLRHDKHGYLTNVFLSNKKPPRIMADQKHKGPALTARGEFDLSDVVQAAIKSWDVGRVVVVEKTLRDA